MYGYENSNDENTHSSNSEMSNHYVPSELNNQTDRRDENGTENSRVSGGGGGINRLFMGVSQQSSENNESARLLRVSKPRYEDEDDEGDDDDGEEDDDSSGSGGGGGGEEGGVIKKRNAVMVGSDYQAAIPDSLCKYGSELPYQNEDKLLWNPCNMTDEEVKIYLAKAQEPLSDLSLGVNSIPTGNHMRDDEQALYQLMQSDYCIEEALKKRKTNALSVSDSVPLWSEEECRNFETGLRSFEKNFRLIQQNNVKTRTVGELIQFYYIWKKTERHDMFAHKRRLEKRKYSLHPGITDYMDRFLEEQEIALFPRDRSTSPNLQSLVYGAMFGQQTSEMTAAGSDSLCNVENQLDKNKLEPFTNLNNFVGNKSSDEKHDSEVPAVSSTTLPTTTMVEMTYSSTTMSASSTLPQKDEVSHAEESMVQ